MDDFTLRLQPDGREAQELTLHTHKAEASILDAAKSTSSYVFCDFKYSGKLLCDIPSEIANLQIFVNGNPVNIVFSPADGSIIFNDFSFGQRIFNECYGFVQISVTFDTPGASYELESEYVQVMVRKGRQNDSVRRMAEYVYKHNNALLYGSKVFPKDAAGLKEESYRTLESRVLLLEQMLTVFEENYRYFHANARFTTVPKEYIDNFEKLQYISGRSIQHMAQHPEELQRVAGNTGIKIGNARYLPNKTLINNSVHSFDIYENRYIVGFLQSMINETSAIESELKDAIAGVPNNPRETDDYVTSSYFIYINTAETLRVVLADVRRLRKKYHDLYSAYSKALPVKKLIVQSAPKPTHIFLSVPQYRQIYDCMVSWFAMGAFTLNEQHYMLSFLRISALYEVYVLSKIIEFFCGCEYTLSVAERKTYTFSGRTYYENTTCNNYYVLEKESSKITVYYQPVIYNVDKSSISGIGLYRNTSISFPKSLGEGSTGSYYSPDYLIKYESTNFDGARYLIADAKFSTVKNVKDWHVASLAYKYLFSISPLNSNDLLTGLCIFNGKSDSETDRLTTIYDFSQSPNSITPNATILTITENSENNTEHHISLLKDIIGRYVN